MRTLLFSTFLLLLISCGQEQKKEAQGDWIKGSEQEKIDIIEEQFGGFGRAMIETSYRYQELYWAGQDENWDYADYQLEHLVEVIEEGLERRPERKKSAEHILTNTLPEMEKAIESKDTVIFNQNFEQLRIDCRSCHHMENVPYIEVTTPNIRISPTKYSK